MLTAILIPITLPTHSHGPIVAPLQIEIACLVLLALGGVRNVELRGVGHFIVIEELGVMLTLGTFASFLLEEKLFAGALLACLVASFLIRKDAGIGPLRGRWLRALLRGLPILLAAIPAWQFSYLLWHPQNDVAAAALLGSAVVACLYLVVAESLGQSRPEVSVT